jgi:hypothetical protein
MIYLDMEIPAPPRRMRVAETVVCRPAKNQNGMDELHHDALVCEEEPGVSSPALYRGWAAARLRDIWHRFPPTRFPKDVFPPQAHHKIQREDRGAGFVQHQVQHHGRAGLEFPVNAIRRFISAGLDALVRGSYLTRKT